ncbi:MAG: ADP-heptose:LPS heptosyltransferase/ADP-heptose:LPS heptosyltransferase [Verrucomicrobia bacterium]|nr:MAG: ADP-heptose:LPS heptosyltransferase/ADP-heptose:LPS heptosyltransferase [Verrucomicrobiota bacterium]
MKAPVPKILVIRGGALGDFILTLPAIRLLRETFPEAELEVLGYPRIASLVDKRFYASRVRSIDYGPMAGFFAKNGVLDPGLSEYFAGFQQVISYMFDPDGIFEANVRRAGVKHYLAAYRRPVAQHAAREWAAPLEALAMYLESPAAQLFPSDSDKAGAREWLGGRCGEVLAVHPGSGSPKKNWGAALWAQVGEFYWQQFPEGEIVLVGGEADAEVLRALEGAWRGRRVRWAVGLGLPELAAVLAECGRFAGHDSGISHLAAAVGAKCVLLFGPTAPEVWAPMNAGVSVLRAPGGDFEQLRVSEVWVRIRDELLLESQAPLSAEG